MCVCVCVAVVVLGGDGFGYVFGSCFRMLAGILVSDVLFSTTAALD